MNLVEDKLEIQALISQAAHIKPPADFAKKLISLLDFTTLNADDNTDKITTLCTQAQTPTGHVAAVCIYPQFVKDAKKILRDTAIKICTVANFPEGQNDLTKTLHEIQYGINQGATEIDVVIPYHTFLAGDLDIISTFVHACKNACGKHICLKVILETGALQKSELIYQASCAAINAGADFIKTSTGKISVNATLDAAAVMLTAIKNCKKPVGFKAAGGIRTLQQAAGYIHLAEQIIGKNWVVPTHFRIGSSILLGITE